MAGVWSCRRYSRDFACACLPRLLLKRPSCPACSASAEGAAGFLSVPRVTEHRSMPAGELSREAQRGAFSSVSQGYRVVFARTWCSHCCVLGATGRARRHFSAQVSCCVVKQQRAGTKRTQAQTSALQQRSVEQAGRAFFCLKAALRSQLTQVSHSHLVHLLRPASRHGCFFCRCSPGTPAVCEPVCQIPQRSTTLFATD